MPKSFPWYLTQEQIDQLAQLLYTHQTLINTAYKTRPTPDNADRFLSDLRGQTCVRSRAEDPFPDLPMQSGIFDGKNDRTRGVKC